MSVLEVYRSEPWLLVATAIVAGLLVGSFLNVVIHRLPKIMERQWRSECAELAGTPAPPAEPFNLLTPRSTCPQCGHRITALQNVPVVSYLALGGRCAACRARIPVRYPIVEILAGAFAGCIAWRYGVSAAMLGALLFAWAMIALTFIDLDTFFTDIRSAVIGAAAGYLLLWTVFWAFKLLTGKEGMGYGDFKLLAAIGAWLGWKMLPLVILLSSFVGAAVGVALIVFARRGRNVPIPFGPYLAAAGLIALFWGDQITQQYLNLF
jgi:leader peptidase (prepilin peptidase)/N-methyltransferase